MKVSDSDKMRIGVSTIFQSYTESNHHSHFSGGGGGWGSFEKLFV